MGKNLIRKLCAIQNAVGFGGYVGVGCFFEMP